MGESYTLDGRNVLRFAIGLGIAACVLGAVWVFTHRPPAPAAPPPPAKVKVGIAYGTEKREWLTWAANEFAQTEEGKRFAIDLKPMGSLEAAQAIVRKDQSIHVWSPASALYKDVFVRDWKDRNAGANPIAKESPLALSPMVFVMWEQRYEALLSKRPEGLSFAVIRDALADKTGWANLGGKPDWMFFKFSHTHPNQSNSGLATLLLMGHDFHGKASGLAGRDITEPKFQEFMTSVERSLTGAASGLVASTGDLMTAMIQRGPSSYDVVMVYENVAIERLKQAEGRWDKLRVVYPRYNLWNDNPYYVLNVPWSSAEQQAGAKVFLEFLLSDRIQAQAMNHGFRPANLNVFTRAADSPFVRLEAIGVKQDVPGAFCDAPSAEVIENLLLLWQRSQAGK